MDRQLADLPHLRNLRPAGEATGDPLCVLHLALAEADDGHGVGEGGGPRDLVCDLALLGMELGKGRRLLV